MALACLALSGCGDGDASKPATTTGPRDAARARCADNECRVRVTCKGKVYVRRGSAPVSIRTTKTALVTTIVADFAGPDDAVIRC